MEQFIELLSVESSRVLSSPSDAEVAMARVQEQAERLALALESHDLSLLRALAGRMVATAGRDGLGDVARIAGELEQSAANHPDVLQIVEKVNELMNLCRSTGQQPATDAPGAQTPQSAVDAGAPVLQG